MLEAAFRGTFLMPSRGKSFRSFLRPPRRPLGLFLYSFVVSSLFVVVERIG